MEILYFKFFIHKLTIPFRYAEGSRVPLRPVYFYSSVPLKDGLKASRRPLPNRLKLSISRLIKMGEDRISISRTDDGFVLEGLRKDVFLYATGLEYSLPKEDEE